MQHSHRTGDGLLPGTRPRGYFLREEAEHALPTQAVQAGQGHRPYLGFDQRSQTHAAIHRMRKGLGLVMVIDIPYCRVPVRVGVS